MDWLTGLAARAARISKHARVALGCQCAVRIRPVYEALREDADETAFASAVELGWVFAEAGARDHAQESDLCRRLEILAVHYAEMEHPPLIYAVTVPLCAVQTMNDDEGVSTMAAARALSASLAVVDSAEATTQLPWQATTEVFQAEEEKWQAAALDIAERWNGLATRSMFDPISSPDGPQWLKQFIASRRS